jgi:hypothetical protein
MSLKQRGQEATIIFNVDGVTQVGSFAKVKDFAMSPRTDINEEEYLGELESDLDIQHHGFDFSFTVDNQDERTLDYLSLIVGREQAQQAHPDITMTILNAYRERNAINQAEIYNDVFMKVTEQGYPGRKENVTTGFEGKCKKRIQFAIPKRIEFAIP